MTLCVSPVGVRLCPGLVREPLREETLWNVGSMGLNFDEGSPNVQIQLKKTYFDAFPCIKTLHVLVTNRLERLSKYVSHHRVSQALY